MKYLMFLLPAVLMACYQCPPIEEYELVEWRTIEHLITEDTHETHFAVYIRSPFDEKREYDAFRSSSMIGVNISDGTRSFTLRLSSIHRKESFLVWGKGKIMEWKGMVVPNWIGEVSTKKLMVRLYDPD